MADDKKRSEQQRKERLRESQRKKELERQPFKYGEKAQKQEKPDPDTGKPEMRREKG